MTIRNAALAALTCWCLAGTQPGCRRGIGWQCPPERESPVTPGTICRESQHDARKALVPCATSTPGCLETQAERVRLSAGPQLGRRPGRHLRDNGCRGGIGCRTTGGGGSPSNRPGRHGTITCESNDDRRKMEVRIDPERQMERRLKSDQLPSRRELRMPADGSTMGAARSSARAGAAGRPAAAGPESSMRRARQPRVGDWADHGHARDHPRRSAAERQLPLQYPGPRRSGHGRPPGNAYRLN